MGLRGGSGRRRAAPLAAFVWASVLVIVPAADAAGTITEVARFRSSMTPASRVLEADVPARRLFEIGQPTGGRGMRVDAYDLDSLAPLARIEIPGAQSGTGRLATVDPVRHRLFVVYPARQVEALSAAGTFADEVTRTVFGIAVIDTLRLRLVGARAVPELAIPPRDTTVSNEIGGKALGYDPASDSLYLVTQVPAGAAELALATHAVVLHEIAVEQVIGAGTTSAVRSIPAPACGSVMAKEDPGAVVRRGGHVFFGCRGGGLGAGTTQPMETPGVARANLADGAVDFFPLSGNFQSGQIAADPAAGRLFVRVDATSTESGTWIFDMPSASWLGFIVTPGGGSWGIGVDPAIGRLYVFGSPVTRPSLQVRVVLASTRSIDTDQGQVVSYEPSKEPIPRRPLIDPVRRRVFWPSATDYAVLSDDVPVPPLRAPADPDANTTGGPEDLGTAVNFLGGAQAYGSRIRFIGGTDGVARNANTLVENIPIPVLPFQSLLPPLPKGGSRDIHLARVSRTTLTSGEGTATAIGADRDRENTDGDLSNSTVYARDRTGLDLVDQRWPYRAVACTDFGGGSDRREDAAEGARVACNLDGGLVKADALARPPVTLPPEITVGESTASTDQKRDPVRGVVTVTQAEAKQILIGGRAGIGRIASRAETWAAGRPGTAGSSYTRTIEDVWVTGPDGGRVQVCTSPCSPQTVVSALNRALGARFRAELPEPDTVRAQGTPGGYEALVVRDPFERANEASLNDEIGIRLEVPALVVTVFADGRTRSRVVASFAATSAESHYGIYLLSRGLGAPAAPAGVLGTAVAGSPVGPSVARTPVSDTLAAPAFVPSPVAVTLQRAVRKLFTGFRFLFASPRQAVRTFAFWSFLAAPLVLLMRRPGAGGA